jgi:ABC-type multidrug transport system ATPase subunit
MVCDRVAILLGGAVAKQGTMDELAAAKQRYEIEFVPTNGTSVALKDVVTRALSTTFTHATPIAPMPIEHGTNPVGQWLELQGNVLRIGTTDPIEAQPMLDALRGAGMLIRRFQQVRPSLEDLFIDAVSNQMEASRPGARLAK